MLGGPRSSRREITLFAAAALFTLGGAEAAARLVERWNPGKFHLLPERTYEAFFFHTRNASKLAKLPLYDSILGWRNAYPPVDEEGVGVKEDGVNPDGWRVEPLHEGRQRIVLIGDSFVFGYGLLEKNTISQNLERELKYAADVVNLGVRGWGLDQMALAATHVGMSYHPAAIILAFIGDDLERSCRDFKFNLSKPCFVMRNGAAEPAGIPVPTPQMKLAEHSTPRRKFLDALETYAVESRLARLAGQVALQPGEQQCIAQLNPAILDYVMGQIGSKTGVLFVHLDGDLPGPFLQRMRGRASFFSLPAQIARISAELRVKPGRLSDGHPDGALNRVYAHALVEILGRVGPEGASAAGRWAGGRSAPF